MKPSCRRLRHTILLILQRYLRSQLYTESDMKNIGFTLGRLEYLTKLVT